MRRILLAGSGIALLACNVAGNVASAETRPITLELKVRVDAPRPVPLPVVRWSLAMC